MASAYLLGGATTGDAGQGQPQERLGRQQLHTQSENLKNTLFFTGFRKTRKQPSGTQEETRSAQNPPRRSPEAPKGSQETPKRSQRSLRRRKERPKRRPRGAKRSEERAEREPERPQSDANSPKSDWEDKSYIQKVKMSRIQWFL